MNLFLGGVFANHTNEIILNESDVISSAESVDTFAAAVSAVAPLDLMPGCKDPSSVMLPQKPFHYCKPIEVNLIVIIMIMLILHC